MNCEINMNVRERKLVIKIILDRFTGVYSYR